MRVGYDASDIERALPDLDKLSNFGLELSVNLMKSNEINKNNLSKKLKKLKDLPLETVSIVDLSGSMLPENVKSMVQTVCEYGFNAGFHGHNNIGLALANCLSAERLVQKCLMELSQVWAVVLGMQIQSN